MIDNFYSTKFIEIINSKFKSNEHQFIIIKKSESLSYIKPDLNENVQFLSLPPHSNTFEAIVTFSKFLLNHYFIIRKMILQSKFIFIHYLTNEISRILYLLNRKHKFIWVVWGADLYKNLPLKLYDNETSKLMEQISKKKLKIFDPISHSFHYIIQKKVMKRFDYIITPLKGDFLLLNKYHKTKAKFYFNSIYPNPVNFEKFSDLTNYKIEEKYDLKKKNEKLILLGNSGFPSNNHFDALLKLKNKDDKTFKIICPLSYGPPNYIEKIITKGKHIFGDRFIPLLDFLDPKTYYHILKQIDVAIMYHNRQQGMASIILLIILGKPVYMKKTSGYYYFKKKGIYIFSIDKLSREIVIEVKNNLKMFEHNKKIMVEDLTSIKSTISSIQDLLFYLNHKKD